MYKKIGIYNESLHFSTKNIIFWFFGSVSQLLKSQDNAVNKFGDKNKENSGAIACKLGKYSNSNSETK
jgi:hypothetical protein